MPNYLMVLMAVSVGGMVVLQAAAASSWSPATPRFSRRRAS
ncbi:hypothetical protein ACLBV4_16810, partial [Pseudomonas aeruginosa]